MQRYVEQMVEDIRKATWNVRPPRDIWYYADPLYDVELEDFSDLEKYFYGEEEPVSQITGIDAELLPPPDRLSENQKTLLTEELDNLLQVNHFKLLFPVKFPLNLRYAFIRKFWSETHVALSFGENEIEFCDYEKIFCPFPGYCDSCDEVEEEMRYDARWEKKTDFFEEGDDDIPF